MTPADDLEVRFRLLSVAIVILFGSAFAAGLMVHVADQGNASGQMLLNAGILLLMAAPIVRVFVATVDRLRRRDWIFLLMTAVVLAELGLVMWRATHK